MRRRASRGIDTGQFYRQVDCKYTYNLDVSSLNGAGTYTVWVRIGGVNIQVPATLDLRVSRAVLVVRGAP